MANTRKSKITEQAEVSKALNPLDQVETLKYCSKCDNHLPLSSFGKLKNSKDGFRHVCKECRKADYYSNRSKRLLEMKRYRDNNKEKIAESKLKCVQAKREYYLEMKRKYYSENKEMILEKARKYRELNKEAIKEQQRKSYKAAPEGWKMAAAQRRARLHKSTPSWLTDIHKENIKSYYKIASILERVHDIKYHVDHIVPLKGNLVCRLHVPWNLQIITAEENMSKGNRFNG